MHAAVIWVSALVNVAGIFAMVGATDVMLAIHGETTVTEFLRESPLWYFVPSLMMLAGIVVLGWHLFIQKRPRAKG